VSDAVILGAVRTPIGRGHAERGWFKDVEPADLLGACFRALFDRTAVDPAEVDDVIAGCCFQYGPQGLNIARNAWLQEGLPVSVPGTTVDRQCGSSQQAVNFAAATVAAGVNDLVVAAGVEHMGRLSFAASDAIQQTYGRAHTERLLEEHALVSQGLAAELIADRWELSRAELDELALRSHRLAARATEDGHFAREIVPIEVNQSTHETDQGIRPDTSLEALAALAPAFKEDGKITAGNSSQISDGAAAVLIASAEKAEELGIQPRAQITAQAAVGVDPVTMLTGPIPATREVLDRRGISMEDVDSVEINEAFAPVVAAWARELGADMDRVNRRGGAMALGHPLGSSGVRLVTTLLHQMEDDRCDVGLVTMCCAGGIGTATLIERV
jgi:acetyl-CoA acetyltransferase family protein